MYRTFFPLLLLSALLTNSTLAQIDGQDVRASDTERLRALLSSRSVELTTKEGAVLKGRAESIEPSLMRLHVLRCSPPCPGTPELRSIPWDKVDSVQFTVGSGPWRFATPVLLGLLGLATAGFLVEEDGQRSWSLPIFTVAGGTAGFLIGRELDQKSQVVRIR
jgi:hypothetical protein